MGQDKSYTIKNGLSQPSEFIHFNVRTFVVAAIVLIENEGGILFPKAQELRTLDLYTI
jgi:hypothetical protein